MKNIILVFSIVSLFASCGMSRADFSANLKRLDTLLSGDGREPSFSKAFSDSLAAASNSSELLSVVSRAYGAEATGKSGLYLATAEAALVKAPRAEPILRIAAHAYLRARKPEKAFSLFGDVLSPEAHVDLWAEAFLSMVSIGSLPRGAASPEAYARLSRALGKERFYVDAALASMRSSDSFSARSYCLLALTSPDADFVPDALLYDLGLYAKLSARIFAHESLNGRPRPEMLRLGADAAALDGQETLAITGWKRAISLDPRGSWESYVNLAEALPSFADYYWAAVAKAFPDSAGALAARAAWLARRGKDVEALNTLARISPRKKGQATSAAQVTVEDRAAAIALIVNGRAWPEDRFSMEAVRFASERPDSGIALATALRIVLQRARSENFLALFEEGERSGLDYAHHAFYAAVAAILRGENDLALSLLLREGTVEPGPASRFAIGLLQLKAGRLDEAEESFVFARTASSSGAERAEALKELGRLYARRGEESKAKASFRAAAQEDPSDAEAAFFAVNPAFPVGKY